MSNLQAIQNFPVNPISGTYGSGKIQLFSASGTFTRPTGVANVRVRLWGGGGSSNGGGGGFAIKEIVGVAATVAVTVGAASGTSSFGALVSATGGTLGSSNPGGSGSGGDYNSTGGTAGGSNNGGGVASIWGNGGEGGQNGVAGASGGGQGAVTLSGNPGLYGSGGSGVNTSGTITSALQPAWNSIDFIGTGGGGSIVGTAAQNGGGGGAFPGGYPGGGGAPGARGLVIVEY
jgi:hypothetical protein